MILRILIDVYLVILEIVILLDLIVRTILHFLHIVPIDKDCGYDRYLDKIASITFFFSIIYLIILLCIQYTS